MPRYMFDTDIASYVMKGSNAAVLTRLQTVPVDDVSISAIVKSELMFGVEVSPSRTQDQARLETFLRYMEVLDYPETAAHHYAQIRAELKRRGTIIGGNDLFIAAHARFLGLILVTNNTRELARVPGLKIENWT
ncbi:MAG TPA: type II toxin-antitoxin system VapC family toxin [Terracidiphilus sp.]|jgi:tRNA(fMet)-specific endonuclease VapC|nr:type II toxin-antitoxin system VapC family toxin [Terracidiphilus sp.]